MPTIHCHICGGFIDDPAGTIYRSPSLAPPPVAPRSALCKCEHAVLYEPAPVLIPAPATAPAPAPAPPSAAPAGFIVGSGWPN